MRTIPLLLLPLLLAGCIRQAATYYIDPERDNTITVRAEQAYFWKDEAKLIVVVSNMPDCQRRYELGTMAAADVVVELFSAGEGVYSMRAGTQLLQIEAQNCTQRATPKPEELGVPAGVFRVGKGDKMDLEMLKAPAPASAPAEPAAEAPAT